MKLGYSLFEFLNVRFALPDRIIYLAYVYRSPPNTHTKKTDSVFLLEIYDLIDHVTLLVVSLLLVTSVSIVTTKSVSSIKTMDLLGVFRFQSFSQLR